MTARGAGEAEAEALLRDLLAGLGRAEHTPLRFGVDFEAMAAAALRRHTPGEGFERGLEDLLHHLLDPDRTPGPPPPSEGGQPPDLARWLSRLHRLLGDVHPLAASILVHRLEGLTDREIARRLLLGRRLVRRIQEDLRRSWALEVGP